MTRPHLRQYFTPAEGFKIVDQYLWIISGDISDIPGELTLTRNDVERGSTMDDADMNRCGMGFKAVIRGCRCCKILRHSFQMTNQSRCRHYRTYPSMGLT